MSPPSSIRALIVDDDAPARQRLKLLVDREDDIVVAGECADGAEAVTALGAGGIDLVFLDVQMPRLDGFGVVAEIGAPRMPPIIFISAYSEFAVRAFEAYALDYLLKPFDDGRFEAALDRARAAIASRRATSAGGETLDERLVGLLEHLSNPRQVTYPEAIAVKTSGQYTVIRVSDIDWIEADGSYTRVYIQRRGLTLTKTLAVLERDVLDPDVFMRVHRSAIVNMSKIATIEPHFHGELTLVLHDGSRVQCSRRHRKQLEQRLYFTT